MQKVEQQQLFDYASLDIEKRVFVQEKVQSIRARLKRTAEDVIAIGLDLIAVKSCLEHGQFIPWLKAEFGMSVDSAQDFMRVAKRFGDKNWNFQYLPVSVLYELAAPSTPDVVIEMVETNLIEPTLPAIREAKHDIAEQKVAAKDEPKTEYATIDDIFPGYSAWKTQQDLPVASNAISIPVIPFIDDVDEEKEYEETEEDRYLSAVDNGTVEYYYDDLRREVIQRDKEEREQRQGLSALNSAGVPVAVPHILSRNNEWYTPAKYVDAARELMGTIDLDPASCESANETVQATRYYDKQTNGFDKPWNGHIWLNPPYGREDGSSNQEAWSRRLIEQYQDGITQEAILLVNAAVDTKWFQRLFDYPICFPHHRINFTTPEPTASGSTHGSALIYFGPKPQEFARIFSQFGVIVQRYQAC